MGLSAYSVPTLPWISFVATEQGWLLEGMEREWDEAGLGQCVP